MLGAPFVPPRVPNQILDNVYNQADLNAGRLVGLPQ